MSTGALFPIHLSPHRTGDPDGRSNHGIRVRRSAIDVVGYTVQCQIPTRCRTARGISE